VLEGPPIRRYVVDASVAVKWFVPEDGSDSARSLKRSYEEGEADILSPPLILFEVANALRYHPVVRLSVEELVTATDALSEMGIIVEMSREIWARAFEISQTEAITTYDAAYLGLALLNDAVFVTADRKLFAGLSEDLKRHATTLSAMR
jgi:predicted nucleic acid-binding protein